MVMELSYTVLSVRGIPIRLTAEQWSHTNACCDDVLSTVERPDLILRGRLNTLVAARRMAGGSYLAVTYRELGPGEGYVIAARITSTLNRRAVLWRSRGPL
jgi:hypothetical protein